VPPFSRQSHAVDKLYIARSASLDGRQHRGIRCNLRRNRCRIRASDLAQNSLALTRLQRNAVPARDMDRDEPPTPFAVTVPRDNGRTTQIDGEFAQADARQFRGAPAPAALCAYPFDAVLLERMHPTFDRAPGPAEPPRDLGTTMAFGNQDDAVQTVHEALFRTRVCEGAEQFLRRVRFVLSEMELPHDSSTRLRGRQLQVETRHGLWRFAIRSVSGAAFALKFTGLRPAIQPQSGGAAETNCDHRFA